MVDGYPWVTKYKYLGTVLSYDGDPKHQLVKINKKAIGLKVLFYPILKRGNLRVNKNLYTIFIEPMYRSMGYDNTYSPQKMKVIGVNRHKNFKNICCLPCSVPKVSVNMLIG